MGDGPTTSSSVTNDNRTFNYQGGSVNLSNLFGNLNYKSSGGKFNSSNSDVFNPSTENKNDTTQEGGSGGGFDVGASVGVGVGGGSGSAGSVSKQDGGFLSSSGTGGSMSPLVLAGIGIGAAFAISQFNKRGGK